MQWTSKTLPPITTLVFDEAEMISFDISDLSEDIGTCAPFKFELIGPSSVLTLPDPLSNTLRVESTSLSEVGIHDGFRVKVTLLLYPGIGSIFSDPFSVTVTQPATNIQSGASWAPLHDLHPLFKPALEQLYVIDFSQLANMTDAQWQRHLPTILDPFLQMQYDLGIDVDDPQAVIVKINFGGASFFMEYDTEWNMMSVNPEKLEWENRIL